MHCMRQRSGTIGGCKIGKGLKKVGRMSRATHAAVILRSRALLEGSATGACGPSFEARREERRAPQDDESCGYRSLIGAAVFSAGAGGSAGWAPAFCASASGRAGSGGTSAGRLPVPVVAGSAGLDGFVSAPGVDCSGWVACAICGLRAPSWATDRPNIATPAATMADAISRSFLRVRLLLSEDIGFTAGSSRIGLRDQRLKGRRVPQSSGRQPRLLPGGFF